MGLLADMTRVLRENGLSISRVEVRIQGERTVGSFYITDASGHDVNPDIVEIVKKRDRWIRRCSSEVPGMGPSGFPIEDSPKHQ
jgi:UTP:GlnB (protein PII) uridylyltransferase